MKVEIYFLSRNYRLLFLLTALILLAGGAIGTFRSGVDAGDGEDEALSPAEALQALEETFSHAAEPEGEAVEDAARYLAAVSPEGDPEGAAGHTESAAAAIDSAPLSPARKQLYHAFWNSLASLSGEPDAFLLTLAYRQRLPGANYLAAQLYLRLKNTPRALFFLRREAIFPQSGEARSQEIDLLLDANDTDALAALRQDPRYADEWPLEAEYTLATHRLEWGRAATALVRMEWEEVGGSVLALVALSGLLWTIVCLQAGQALEAPFFRGGAAIAALCFGAASTVPAVLLDVWVERHLGLAEGKGLLGDTLFFLGSVGPREELCKLLGFVPLLPLLLARRNRLEILLTAGFAGLGFAVAENFQYFAFDITAAFGRFLTANFLHVAATGVLGLALAEAVLDPVRKGWRFPALFLLVSALHGAYDLFLVNALLHPLEWISPACFLWLALLFFKRLRQYRSAEVNYFWMPATILLGLAVLVAVTFVLAAGYWSAGEAARLLAVQGVGLSMFVYILIWQTGNLRLETAHSPT